MRESKSTGKRTRTSKADIVEVHKYLSDPNVLIQHAPRDCEYAPGHDDHTVAKALGKTPWVIRSVRDELFGKLRRGPRPGGHRSPRYDDLARQIEALRSDLTREIGSLRLDLDNLSNRVAQVERASEEDRRATSAYADNIRTVLGKLDARITHAETRPNSKVVSAPVKGDAIRKGK